MAVYSIADLSTILPTSYQRTYSTIVRAARTLRMLSGIGAFKRCATGNTITWNVKFSGQAAAAVNLDGGAFVTPTSDERAAATLAIGSYAAPAKISDRLQWTGTANGGYGADINPLANAYSEAIAEATHAWVKIVNEQIFQGSGSSNQMVGGASALAATGTYAGINQATRAAWASTVTANGGVLQTLTLARVKTILRTIGSTNNPYGRPNLCICRGAVFDTFEGLFDAYATINTELGAAPPISRESVVKNPSRIALPGGDIGADGLRAMYWQTAGLWVLEDNDAVDTGATNTNNTLFFFHSNDIEFQYVPPPGNNEFRTDHKVIQAAEQMLGDLGTMPLDLAERGRQDYSDTWDVTGMCSIVFHTRSANGKLQDQQ